jgi:hypothetical protein
MVLRSDSLAAVAAVRRFAGVTSRCCHEIRFAASNRREQAPQASARAGLR